MGKIEDLRQKIDLLDERIIKLLSQRMDIVEKIGTYKKDTNIPILQKNRWEELISSRKKFAKKQNLEPEFIEEIWNTIHILSQKNQK